MKASEDPQPRVANKNFGELVKKMKTQLDPLLLVNEKSKHFQVHKIHLTFQASNQNRSAENLGVANDINIPIMNNDRNLVVSYHENSKYKLSFEVCIFILSLKQRIVL